MYENTENKTKRRPKLPRLILMGIAALLIVITLMSSFSVVPEGYTGTTYRFGKLVQTDTGSGLKLHAPFIETIRRVDIRAQVYETNMMAYTKDTQVVESFPVKVAYMYDRAKLDYIIGSVGINNVESTLLVPNVPSISKNFIGKYKGEELTQNRARLEGEIEEMLREELSPYGIIITDFNVLDIDFENAFEENIRAKVAAEVAAQTTRNETATLEEKARQKVIAATAEADAIKVKADADAYAISVIQEQLQSSPQYIELERVKKWNGQWPQVMGDSVNPFINLTPNTAGN